MDNSISTPAFPQKAAVIIDGGYWRKVQEALQLSSVDFQAFTDSLCDPAYRIRTLFFDGKTQENQSFHDSLRLLDRFEVVLGDVVPKTIHCPHCDRIFNMETQKRVDVSLAVELVHLATSRHVDMIALVAGDRDFLPAITTAKHAGVIIRLIHGKNSTVSEQLYQSVDERVEITRKYFDDKKIKTVASARSAAPKVIKDITEKNNPPHTDEDEIFQVLNRILIKHTAKTGQTKMNGADLGTELGKESPGWAKKYHVKQLKDLVAMVSDKVEWKIINTVGYASLVTTSKTPKPEQGEKSIRAFLLDALQTAVENNPNEKSYSGQYYGQILRKMDKNWRKTFSVKSLTDALDSVKDKIACTGSGATLRIKPKQS